MAFSHAKFARNIVGMRGWIGRKYGSKPAIADDAYGVSEQDPAIYAAVFVFLLSVAVAASLIPAWRASRIEPMQVLRKQ